MKQLSCQFNLDIWQLYPASICKLWEFEDWEEKLPNLFFDNYYEE